MSAGGERNDRRRADYVTRKMAGVCPRCDTPSDEDSVLCRRHREKQVAAQRRYRRRQRGSITCCQRRVAGDATEN